MPSKITAIKIFGAGLLWQRFMSEWSPVMLLGVNQSLIGGCSGKAPGYQVSCREDGLHATEASNTSALHQSNKSVLTIRGQVTMQH